MNWLQQIILTQLPKSWSDQIRASTQKWQVRCKTCNTTRCAWDVGMIRLGAWSVGKVAPGRCSKCGTIRLLAIENKAPAEPSQ